MKKCRSTPHLLIENKILAEIQLGGVHRERCAQQLYSTFEGLIYFGCRQYGLSLEEASDIYSDSIAYVVHQIDQRVFRGEARIGTYLHRIFCNRCLSFKRNARVLKRQGITEELTPIADHRPDPYAIAQTNDNIRLLEQACHEIGPHCQQIVWDSAYHGFSMQEIAKRTGLKSAASVATLKSRYVQRLRKMVG